MCKLLDAVTAFDGLAVHELAVAAFAAWADRRVKAHTVRLSQPQGTWASMARVPPQRLRLDRGPEGVPVPEWIPSVVGDQLVTDHDVTVAVRGGGRVVHPSGTAVRSRTARSR
jgi:hypothetical protein